MPRNADGDLLFQQYTSSVPQRLKDAQKRNQKIRFRGREDEIVGWGQHGFPGQKGYRITAHLRHAGEVNYEEIRDLF